MAKGNIFKVGNILRSGDYFVMVTSKNGNEKEDMFLGVIVVGPQGSAGFDDGFDKDGTWKMSSLLEAATQQILLEVANQQITEDLIQDLKENGYKEFKDWLIAVDELWASPATALWIIENSPENEEILNVWDPNQNYGHFAKPQI